MKPAYRPIDVNDDNFGAVLNCAIRYCLGRRTYMPKLVMDYVRPLLPDLSDKALWCMEKDILQHEADGYSYGDPTIDVPAWHEFLSQVQQEIARRKEDNATKSGTTLPL